MALRAAQASGFDSKGNRTESTAIPVVTYDEKEFDNLPGIDETLLNMSFVGFKPEVMRQTIKQLPTAKPKEIAFLIASYVQIGNRPENALDGRRAKPDGRVVKLVSKYRQSLARIAIAYMPYLYLVRKRAKAIGALQNQFPESKVEDVLQDVAFSGWLGDDIFQFLLMFDDALKPTGSPQQHGREAVRRWMEVSKRGFENDRSVKAALADLKNEKAIETWFLSQFNQ